MKNVNSLRLFLLAITVATLMVGGCAGLEQAHHGYFMKGSILEKTGDDVYLCIGTKDGTKVGQELDVYRSKRSNTKSRDWERVFTGKVKITEIVDEHFAKGKVISGTVKENDIAEL
ncbi:hypothetical protein [Candidatus Magnetomonas plexicatena]|uniref:hypothetical protein n=1 Tax=Candidatus Magnetomonas plexicatena TaxID=2552947 RepID=UPI001C74F43B|nr:hypothetical protein E2O03_005025 [Nitrospirales bacterium LBB_01]